MTNEQIKKWEDKVQETFRSITKEPVEFYDTIAGSQTTTFEITTTKLGALELYHAYKGKHCAIRELKLIGKFVFELTTKNPENHIAKMIF